MRRKSFLPHKNPMWVITLPLCSTTSAARCCGRQIAAEKSFLQMRKLKRYAQ